MKKSTKALMAVLAFMLSVVLLAGCGDDGSGMNKGDNGSSGSSPKDIYVQKVADIAEYKIVRPENGDVEKKALVALNAGFKERLGINLKAATDYSGSSGKEILIGATNRPESKEAAEGLRMGDFKICQKGDKIVIVGGSEKALMDAVDFAIEYLMCVERNSFDVPVKDGFTRKINYISDKISVEGVDIGEFKIASEYYTDFDTIVAKIQNEVIGVTLDTSKIIAPGEHYILLDNTELMENEYSIKVEDGNIVISGSYNSIDDAIDYFCSDFLKNNGGKNVSLTNGVKYEGNTEKKDIYTKDQVMTVLTDVYNDPNKFIVGQQADEIKYPLPSATLDQFLDSAGELPGILGVDLGCYGMYIQQYNEAQWSQAICELVDFAAQGGIIEISSHLDNPVDPSQYVRGYLGEFETVEELDQAFTDLITEGTEINKAFKETIARDGRFLQALRDNGVPVLWRPFHEMNGSHFWFCVTSGKVTASAEVWKNVWKYLYNFYTSELKLDNLIWIYSPNVDAKMIGGVPSTMYCFPGKEYCDMVGVDWYFDNTEKTDPPGYKEVIDGTGYIGAMTEMGMSGSLRADPELGQNQSDIFNCSDFDRFLSEIAKSGNKFAYVLSWNHRLSFSSMGGCDVFMGEEYTLGAKDLKALFDKMK